MNRIVGFLLSNNFFLAVMRYHAYRVAIFIKKIASTCDIDGKKVLDIGAEELPYRKYFKKARYYSQDIAQNNNKTINYICDLNEGLSCIEDQSFDYIICTQVLEHLKKPHFALKEFCRVLKPGGEVFLTTHLCFEEHMAPNDFFRFTKYGLKYLGESNDFTLTHIKPHGGIFHVVALIFDTLLIKLFFKRGTFLYYAYLVVFFVPIFMFNLLCYFLDYLDKKKDMTINYECIYRKNIKK